MSEELYGNDSFDGCEHGGGFDEECDDGAIECFSVGMIIGAVFVILVVCGGFLIRRML